MEGNAAQNQFANDEGQTLVTPTPAETPSEPNPAFNIGAFDGRERLATLHREITDFLHYQSHVRLYAASSLPPLVPRPDDDAKLRITYLLQEENRRLKNLHKLLNQVEANNKELIEIYESTRTDYDWNHH
jgi:hypothetical protein